MTNIRYAVLTKHSFPLFPISVMFKYRYKYICMKIQMQTEVYKYRSGSRRCPSQTLVNKHSSPLFLIRHINFS